MNRTLRNTVAAVATCLAVASPAVAKKKQKDADLQPAPQAANPAAQGGAAAAPTVESSAPPSKTLERALKLYDSEDYYMSSIELNKVVEGQSGDDEGNLANVTGPPELTPRLSWWRRVLLALAS